MQLRNLLLIATLAAPVVSFARTTSAEEGKEKEKIVKLEDIPAPARQTIVKEANGSAILRVEIERHKGQDVYEGVIKRGKDEVGIVVDAKGRLLGKHSEKNEKGEH